MKIWLKSWINSFAFEEREGSTDLFAEIGDFDDIITDDSDDYDDDGYQPQVSDDRVRFSPFAQEASKTSLIETVV